MSLIRKAKQFIYETTGFGSNQFRAVTCLIVTEHGKVLTQNLRAVSGYLVDDELHQAFLLDHNSEVPVKNESKHVLILDEKDAFPWIAGKKSSEKRKVWSETICDIAASEWARQKSLYDEKVAKDKNIRLILMIFALTAIVLVLIILLSFGMNMLKG